MKAYMRIGMRARIFNLPRVLLELPNLARLQGWWRHPWNVHPTWRGAFERGAEKVREQIRKPK